MGRDNKESRLESRLFEGERGMHLQFTKRLGAVLVGVCAGAVALTLLGRSIMVYYQRPRAAAEGGRVCLVYQEKAMRREAESYFIRAEGENWGKRTRFFGDCSGAALIDGETFLFFAGASYARYLGDTWEKADALPFDWPVMASAWAGERLFAGGGTENVSLAEWHEGEWSGEKGPTAPAEIRDLALVPEDSGELVAVWSDAGAKWLAKRGKAWGEGVRIPVGGSAIVAATAAKAEGRIWLFYAEKRLQFAEVDLEGKVHREMKAPRRLGTAKGISGIEAVRVGDKAWVFLTGFGGVRRVFFDGEKWEAGGWVARVSLVSRVETALWLALFSAMPILTIIMAVAVFRLQEAFRNLLSGRREGYAAAWWKRGTAQLLDGLLFLPISLGVFGLLAERRPLLFGASSAVLWAAYMVTSEGVWGKTLGKASLGLVVVGENGGRAGMARACVRNLMRIVDFLPAGYGVGVMAATKSELRQRLGDRVAATVVLNAAALDEGKKQEARAGRG